jgi:hypothetical protein
MRAVIALLAFLTALPAYAQVEYQRKPDDVSHQRTATPGLIWGSEVVIDDRPCCETQRGAPSADGAEATVMATIPGQAVRDGRVLTLRLDGGRTLRITDCDDRNACGSGFREHRLVAWWSSAGLRYYVVDVMLHENQMAFLVRASDALVILVAAPPVLSPHERYAIAWDPSLINGGPVMELLDLVSNPPAIGVIMPGIICRDKTVYPGKQLVWRSDTEVVFDDSTFLMTNSPRFRLTLQIVADTNLRWECQL